MASQGGKVEGQGKRNGKLVSKCQRPKRCSSLEPVLEHCELATEDFTTNTGQSECSLAAQSSPKGIPLRILAKLRDGYVKLMNEMASGADLAGVSSFYGAAGQGDYPTSMMLNNSRRPSAVA